MKKLNQNKEEFKENFKLKKSKKRKDKKFMKKQIHTIKDHFKVSLSQKLCICYLNS